MTPIFLYKDREKKLVINCIINNRRNYVTMYDEHTLFVKCDTANKQQITEAFMTAFDNYTERTGEDVDCRFRVNIVTRHDGTSLGIAFVFLTNSAFYYMFIGKNPDGSDRIEYRDDPAWSPALEGSKINEAGWSNISPSVTKQNGPSKIAVTLEPLIVLPPYELTEEQIEEKRKKIIALNEGKKDFDSSLIEIPKLAYFTLDRARCEPLDKKYMPHILKCRDVPEWLSKEELKRFFTPFASDSTTIQTRTVKGQHVREAYPFVNINNNRVAFIIFDSSTNDAGFALHMCKKTTFNNGKNSVTLVFNHSYRTDRDSMSEINQHPQPVDIKRASSNSIFKKSAFTTKKSSQPQPLKQVRFANPYETLENY